ncbi:hypothetical protein GCM10010912_00560 [Paenibacillus albidus]|uniref:Uncharacterized protein n=1 Tax=Paenibacillus albidus TaxID=2041023 RepID=A0A917BUM2_9BACL|nr:hypothetical protein GCM10010912_00560 [Paenibacillus albidus]
MRCHTHFGGAVPAEDGPVPDNANRSALTGCRYSGTKARKTTPADYNIIIFLFLR